MRETLERILGEVPTLRGVLARARTKYASLNGVRGTVQVSADEAADLGRIGCHVPPSRRVPLDELDRALRATRLGAGLRDVLEVLGGPLRTRADRASARAERWASIQARMEAAAPSPEGRRRVARWLERDASYLQAAAKSEDRPDPDPLVLVARALDALPDPAAARPLAHFATSVAGDAHALDHTTEAGRALLRALAAQSEDRSPGALATRAAREELLADFGLLLDDLSSTVLVVGFEGGGGYLEPASAAWHPIALPLYAVQRLDGELRPRNGTKRVFAVENPAVFRMLLDRALDLPAARRPALVCTSGELSLAARRLMDHLAESGHCIHYSGDLDDKGVDIALRLRRRQPDRLTLWRMGEEDHAWALARAVAGPGIAPSAVDRIGAELPALAAGLAQGTAHQEILIERLWQDILTYCG